MIVTQQTQTKKELTREPHLGQLMLLPRQKDHLQWLERGRIHTKKFKPGHSAVFLASFLVM